MCGIIGFWDKRKKNNHEKLIAEMGKQIRHRGPDDSGIWLDKTGDLAFGHQRLSILDLSAAGHQPMQSFCDRYVIVFNGEIYNHLEIRKQLSDVNSSWQGHSDTETLLTAISVWGLEKTLLAINGMFAFALWDKRTQLLTLVRDRLGEKPLYYGWQNNSFLFSSELKALKVHPDFQGEIDRNVITLFLRHNCIPAPYSIYKGIKKLPPGTSIQLNFTKQTGGLPEPVPYWQAKDVAENGVSKQFELPDEEMIFRLENLLKEVIAEKMISDAPLGVFLSGGIDSSLVTAMMQSIRPEPIKTFSMGFHEKAYDEAGHAKQIAKSLGTDHTEMYVTAEQAMQVIPRLPQIYDEPFADSSQIPMILLSELTKTHVKVALSGDGGDELFAGYNRYLWGQSLWNKLSLIPRPARKLFASLIMNVPPSSWDSMGSMLGNINSEFNARAGDKLHKFAGVLAVDSPEQMYQELVSHWKNPESVVLGSREPPSVLIDSLRWAEVGDFTHRMQFLDSISYLPDDILVKVDRAAMAVGLETRVPFLDHRVFEFAWRVPMQQKIRTGQGKWLLRQVLYRYVPAVLIDRPKMGFGIPIDSWLRGPLRDWAEALLDEHLLRESGFFDVDHVRQIWREHLTGQRNWQYLLWDVLMFQAWLEV